MTAPRQPLFVARRTYRDRRLMDGARVLPAVGAGLFALPVLWPADPSHTGSTAWGGLYVMLVWLCLIVAAGALARSLARFTGEEPGAPPSVVPPVVPRDEDI